MDFAQEGNLAFEAGAYDSITQPVIHFSEMDDYPKQYVVTNNPLDEGPSMVIMDNAELKGLRAKQGKPIYSRKVKDWSSPYKPNKRSISVQGSNCNEKEQKKGSIIRTATENFSDLFERDDRMKWLLFSILIIFVSLVIQTFNLYTNNIILSNMIKLNNPNTSSG